MLCLGGCYAILVSRISKHITGNIVLYPIAIGILYHTITGRRLVLTYSSRWAA
jgi:hypothetical protein